MSRSVSVRCPGKVNLHLEVLGKRRDGYHELSTLFAAVGVWDEVRVTPDASGEIALAVEPEGTVSAGGDNLVARAARAALAAWGVPRGARITLRKEIPVGGGMGGGSADAAATLIALAALWGERRSQQELADVASSLGSDVPYFLLGGAAWGRGRGTELTALPDLPRWWLVLLPGESPISTAAVYGRLGLDGSRAETGQGVYDAAAAGLGVPLDRCRNDLEPVVAAHWPDVAERLSALRTGAPLAVMLSGSGGTVFAVHAEESDARAQAETLRARRPLVAPVLSRAQSTLRPLVTEER